MRDLMLMAAMAVLIPFAFSNTAVAFMLWAWTAVISPNYYMYGFMQSVPFNMVFALITMIGLMLRPGTRDTGTASSPAIIYVIFTLFAIQALLSASLAYPGIPRNWEKCTDLLKILLFCFVMPSVLTTRALVHSFLIVLALGLGFHGVVEGLKVLASGGGHQAVGPAKLGDNNYFAVAMCLTIPILAYLGSMSATRLLSIAFHGSAWLTAICVIGTQSRGGLVALAAMALWMTISSGRKMLALFMLVIGVAALLAFAPSSWFERMDTIKTANEDSSFMTRVVAWKVGSSVALANPVFGGGFDAALLPHVWQQYKDSGGLIGFVSTPDAPERSFAAHSIYFQVMGDMGFVGLGIFLSILLWFFVTAISIVRATKANEETRWMATLANSLIAGVLAYVIGGAAISAAYYEVVYMVFMLIEVLRRLALRSARPVSLQ